MHHDQTLNIEEINKRPFFLVMQDFLDERVRLPQLANAVLS